MQLPSEVHQHIRQYGYTPFISDEALYELIQDINPYFSIRDLYFHYVNWYNQVEDIKEVENIGEHVAEMYDKVLKDRKFFISIESETITFKGIEKEAFKDFEREWTVRSNYNNDAEIEDGYLAEYLLQYVNLMNSNPLSPTIITHEWSEKSEFRLASKRQNHKLKYDSFDPEALRLLQELEPKFSLHKEYVKWQKIKSSKAPESIINNSNFIRSLYYDEEIMLLHITLKGYNNIDPKELEYDETGYTDRMIKNITKKQFIAICLALWNERYPPSSEGVSSCSRIDDVNYL
jgi:hypothetical protein